MRKAPAIGILLATGAFLAIVAWLHVARPDLDPSVHGVSRYAAGPYGYGATAAFGSLLIALVIAASQLEKRSRWTLATAAVGLLLVVLSPLRSQPASRLEYLLHQLGGAVFFIAAATGIQAVPVWLSAASAPTAVRASARASGVVAGVSTIVFFVTVAMRGSSANLAPGLFQRVSFAAISVTLAMLGVGLIAGRQNR